LGHENDAATFNQLPNIGPGEDLCFPDNCCILGDSIYPNRYPVVTPYRANQIARQQPREQRRRRKFNRQLRRYRIYVEHVIKEIKTFRVIGSLYRHPRWELACLVELCAGMAQRRVRIIEGL
jgi:hypothetical protein